MTPALPAAATPPTAAAPPTAATPPAAAAPHPAAPPEELRADGGDYAEEDRPAGPERVPVRPRDVHAVLDDDDEAGAFDGGDGDSDPGAMSVYRRAVFRRLKLECSAAHDVARDGEKWLLGMLREEGSEWWLRAWRARNVCAKLELTYGEPAYYVDIWVWLPDMRWGDIDVDVSKLNLTGDQQYLAERAGTKLPLLPVYGKAECKLFAQLLLGQPTQQVRLHHISIDDSRDPERLETKI